VPLSLCSIPRVVRWIRDKYERKKYHGPRPAAASATPATAPPPPSAAAPPNFVPAPAPAATAVDLLGDLLGGATVLPTASAPYAPSDDWMLEFTAAPPVAQQPPQPVWPIAPSNFAPQPQPQQPWPAMSAASHAAGYGTGANPGVPPLVATLAPASNNADTPNKPGLSNEDILSLLS